MSTDELELVRFMGVADVPLGQLWERHELFAGTEAQQPMHFRANDEFCGPGITRKKVDKLQAYTLATLVQIDPDESIGSRDLAECISDTFNYEVKGTVSRLRTVPDQLSIRFERPIIEVIGKNQNKRLRLSPGLSFIPEWLQPPTDPSVTVPLARSIADVILKNPTLKDPSKVGRPPKGKGEKPTKVIYLDEAPPPNGTWNSQGLCRSIKNKEIFFATENELADLAAAKLVCESCTVQAICLEVALDTGEQFGVWGGHSAKERLRILRRRRRNQSS